MKFQVNTNLLAFLHVAFMGIASFLAFGQVDVQGQQQDTTRVRQTHEHRSHIQEVEQRSSSDEPAAVITRIQKSQDNETTDQQIRLEVRGIDHHLPFDPVLVESVLNDTRFRMIHQNIEVEQVGGTQETQYWLGVDCTPAPSSLLVQLDLKQGLVVEAVAPDSPASRAGFQAYDVIFDYDGNPLDSVDQLVEVIQSKRESEASVQVVRRGNLQRIVVQAEPRLEEADVASVYTIQTVVDKDVDVTPIEQALTRWTDAHSHDANLDGILRMRVLRPGLVLDSDNVEVARRISVGDGRLLQMYGSPGNPLRVEFQDDEQVMTVVAENVANLPDEYRTFVIDAAKQFHWHHGPVHIGDRSFSFFPNVPLVGSGDDEEEHVQFEFHVINDNEEVIVERPPFRVRSIELGSPEERQQIHRQWTRQVIIRQRKELEQSVMVIERELESLRLRLDALERLEERWQNEELQLDDEGEELDEDVDFRFELDDN